MFSVCVQLVLQFVKPSGIVVSASLIVKRAISFNSQPFPLRLRVGLEVVATLTIPEVHYDL